MRSFCIKQCDHIGVATKTVLHQIADNQRQFFGFAFGLGVLGEVGTLGSKANAERRFFKRGNFSKDIGVGYQLYAEFRICLFDFLC